MLRRRSLARMQAELGALQASAERAGAALACVYSSSHELQAAELAARSADRWLPYHIDGLRLFLAAAVLAACATLVALLTLAL